MSTIEIKIENNSQKAFIEKGISAARVADETYGLPMNFVAVHVDGLPKSLDFEIIRSCTLHYIPRNTVEGSRIYASSLIFLLQRAVRDILGKGVRIDVMHTIQSNYYIEIDDRSITPDELKAVEERMRQYINRGSIIRRTRKEFSEAMALFASQGESEKVELRESRSRYWMDIYELESLEGSDTIYADFYSPLISETEKLKDFGLCCFGDGFVLELPATNSENDKSSKRQKKTPLPLKLHRVFDMNSDWLNIMGFDTVGALNKKILKGEGSSIIRLAEALQEKNFSFLAESIFSKHNDEGLKVVFISGPSSSGKTTFAKRLSVHLSVLGLVPKSISLDDYFVNREETPLDEEGNYDFEALEAVDVPRFKTDLQRLLCGEEVELPLFDFKSGKSQSSGNFIQISSNNVLLIEGIHALNPSLSLEIPRCEKYLVYVSALTTLSIDKYNIIHTSDNRLLRRMVRDNMFRGRSAQTTISGWGSVRRGEERHIFPYQENADYMFNTALVFEFSILRHYAEPLLRSVPAGSPEHYNALRLLNFLELFDEIPEKDLPTTSLFREFLGGSSFHY